MIEYCRSMNIELIVGCDANAHQEVWGSTVVNIRGVELLEYIAGTQMNIANRGNELTFIAVIKRKVLDLTLASMKIYG